MNSLLRVFHSSRGNTSDSSTHHPHHPSARNTPSTNPTIIELFQSQSCSSCPPTNANLLNLLSQSSNPNTIALTYHVTYWNHLNWTDTFSLPAADRRQRDYVRRMGLRSAFTPQIVVNGRSSGVGNTTGEFGGLVKQGEVAKQLDVDLGVRVERSQGADGKTFNTMTLTVSDQDLAGRELEIWYIRYDPQAGEVKIASGENRGRTLPYQNVVKVIESLGVVRKGGESVFRYFGENDGLEGVVLAQDGNGGPIVGAAKV